MSSEGENNAEFVGYLTPETAEDLVGTGGSQEKEEEFEGGEELSSEEKLDSGISVTSPDDLGSLSDEDLIAYAEDHGIEINDDTTREGLEEVLRSKLEGKETKGGPVELDEYGFPVVPKALEPYKQSLLRAYHRKTQGNAALVNKARLVDAINENPGEVLPELARRFGLELGKKEETSKMEDIPFDENMSGPEWIQKVLKIALPGAIEEVMKKQGYKPKGQENRSFNPDAELRVRQENAIRATFDALDDIDPEWTRYEAEMRRLVTERPYLLGNPEKLYKLGSGGARKESLSKRMKGKESRTGERATPPRKLVKTAKGKKLSFNDAWDLAIRQDKLSRK